VGLVKNGKEVHVGADPDTAIEVLKAGAQGGFTSAVLPDGFSAPYQSHIWRAGESGFGVLSFNGKVVMAMTQEANSTPDHLSELKLAQQALVGDANQPTIIEGNKVSYWFWHADYSDEGVARGQTMMVMAFQRETGKIYIATAMGDDAVLNTLGINESQARKDELEADEILHQREAEQNKSNNTKR
jgi:hypothetical protein